MADSPKQLICPQCSSSFPTVESVVYHLQEQCSGRPSKVTFKPGLDTRKSSTRKKSSTTPSSKRTSTDHLPGQSASLEHLSQLPLVTADEGQAENSSRQISNSDLQDMLNNLSSTETSNSRSEFCVQHGKECLPGDHEDLSSATSPSESSPPIAGTSSSNHDYHSAALSLQDMFNFCKSENNLSPESTKLCVGQLQQLLQQSGLKVVRENSHQEPETQFPNSQRSSAISFKQSRSRQTMGSNLENTSALSRKSSYEKGSSRPASLAFDKEVMEEVTAPVLSAIVNTVHQHFKEFQSESAEVNASQLTVPSMTKHTSTSNRTSGSKKSSLTAPIIKISQEESGEDDMVDELQYQDARLSSHHDVNARSSRRLGGKLKKIRRKTQTTSDLLEDYPLHDELANSKHMTGSTKDKCAGPSDMFSNQGWMCQDHPQVYQVGMMRRSSSISSPSAPEHQTHDFSTGAQRQPRHQYTRTMPSSAMPERIEQEDYIHQADHRPQNLMQFQGLPMQDEAVPYGEHNLLIPVRTAAGHVSLLPLSNQLEEAFAPTNRRRVHQMSMPHIIRAPLNSQTTTRANSVDFTPITPNFEPWSPFTPLHRTTDEPKLDIRWNAGVAESRTRNLRRGADRRSDVNKNIRLLNGAYNNLRGRLPENLTSAILQNYPDVNIQFEKATRGSYTEQSLPSLTTLPKIRERFASGPARLENDDGLAFLAKDTNSVYLTAQEEGTSPVDTTAHSYTATDISLPTYNPSNGSVSWAKLYITTSNRAEQNKERSEQAGLADDIPTIHNEGISRSRHSGSSEIADMLTPKSGVSKHLLRSSNGTIHHPLHSRVMDIRLHVVDFEKAPQLARAEIFLIDKPDSVPQIVTGISKKRWLRCMVKPRHEKVCVLQEEMLTVTPYKPPKVTGVKPAISPYIFHIQPDHLDKTKRLKVYTMHTIKERCMDEITLKEIKRVSPVRCAKADGDPITYSVPLAKCSVSIRTSISNGSSYKSGRSSIMQSSSRPAYGTDEYRMQSMPGSAEASYKNMQEVESSIDATNSKDSFYAKLQKERQAQLEMLQEKHGVTRSSSGLKTTDQVKEGPYAEAVELVKALRTILDEQKRAALSGSQQFSDKSGLSDQITDIFSEQPSAILKPRPTPKNTSVLNIEKPVLEASEVMSKLEILQKQQQNLSEMIERLNNTVTCLDTKSASTTSPDTINKGISDYQESSVELSRRESPEGTVVVTLNKKSSTCRLAPEIQNGMDRIIADWSARKSRLPSTNSLALEARNNCSAIYDHSKNMNWNTTNLSETLKQKVALLRQNIADLEMRLSTRPDANNQDSLLLILDFLRTTMAKLAPQ